MVARTKSKKTTSSKTKKTGAASRAKPRAKRTTKGRFFVQRPKPCQQEQAGVEYAEVARKTSKTVRAKTKNAVDEAFETKADKLQDGDP